jgi:hypothetical protein
MLTREETRLCEVESRPSEEAIYICHPHEEGARSCDLN